LRARRGAAGLSRVALARRAKISDATVKFVETARHPPSWATLTRLLAVSELKLTWENVPGKLGAASLAAMALVSETEQPPTDPVGLNCYIAPTLEPVQMVAEFGRVLRGSGGLIDPASVYLDHHSAAGYMAIWQQHGATLDHRRQLPLAGVAKLIMGATSRPGLSVVALGSGDAQSEVRLVQHFLAEQPPPDLQLWLVDISQPLLSIGLKHALDTLGSHPGVKVFAVQGNFHHVPTFATLGDVPDAASGKPARSCRVYSMLGGTMESVDNELRFAEHTIDAKPGDWLVLDVQPVYGSSSDPGMIRRKDPLMRAPLPRAYAEWLSGPIYRHCKDVRSIGFSLSLDTHTGIHGSYAVEAIATVQAGDRADTRQFVMFRWKRYDVEQLTQGLAKSGWAHIATLPCGTPASGLPVAMVFRKCPTKEAAEDFSVQIKLPAAQTSQEPACVKPAPSPTHDTPARTMEKGQKEARSSLRTASAPFLWLMILLGLLASPPALGQTAPTFASAPRPINPTLGSAGGSCGTLMAPCPAISRLGLFVWLSGQYLGTGLGGNPHASTLGGSVDVTMEVANRVAVSASIPGALSRIQGQNGEEVWGIGGPLDARVRVRLGPATPGFHSIQARPLWSSVIEVRTQFLIPGFDGDAKYVGRVQRGFVQPAVYGAGELNVWRFQFAPGIGILVGDRQAHADLSLRASVQLLDRLFGDVEALRRQALAVPNEPGRCQSAWMGAAGVRFQLRRGMFLSARYVAGCAPALVHAEPWSCLWGGPHAHPNGRRARLHPQVARHPDGDG
jgi:transcriptional regulator with XRE-family HTH domain